MRLIDADALDYELGASDREIYAKACLELVANTMMKMSFYRNMFKPVFYEVIR